MRRRRPRVRIVIAYRAARTRLARFMTGSVAVHGALLAAVLIVPSTRHRVTPIDDSMVVSLVGPIVEARAPSGGSVSAPTVKQAQVAAPTATPPRPSKEARTVREVPDPKPKSKLVKIKKEPEKPQDSETPESSDAPDTSEAPTPNATKPTGGPPGASPHAAVGGAVTAMVGGGDSTLGWYGAAVKAALESAWVKPYLEDSEGTASVVLAFDIARDGTPRNIRVETSSGIQSLDRSAQRAAIEAAPFPAVPPTWTEDTIPVTMRFDLTPEPR